MHSSELMVKLQLLQGLQPSSRALRPECSIGLEGGLNTYGYANANPLKYIDPLGFRGTGGRGSSAMEAIADVIDQGLCGLWPGAP